MVDGARLRRRCARRPVCCRGLQPRRAQRTQRKPAPGATASDKPSTPLLSNHTRMAADPAAPAEDVCFEHRRVEPPRPAGTPPSPRRGTSAVSLWPAYCHTSKAIQQKSSDSLLRQRIVRHRPKAAGIPLLGQEPAPMSCIGEGIQGWLDEPATRTGTPIPDPPQRAGNVCGHHLLSTIKHHPPQNHPPPIAREEPPNALSLAGGLPILRTTTTQVTYEQGYSSDVGTRKA